MLKGLSLVCVVVNTMAGLALALTRGGILGRIGLPPPALLYVDLLATFLVASGLGFIPAVQDPSRQRLYLWIFGVGVKLSAALLLARLTFSGLVGGLVGLCAVADAAIAVLFIWALLATARK